MEQNVYGAVREILAANGPEPIRASAVAITLRDRGFANMHPQNARAVLGAQIQELSERTWVGTPEVLSALERLEDELPGPDVTGAGSGAQRTAAPPKPMQAAQGAPPAASSAASAPPAPAVGKKVVVPAGLPVALRVVLRQGPAAPKTIHRALVKMGWPPLGPSTLTAALASQPQIFECSDGTWRLATGSATVVIVPDVPRKPVQVSTTLREPVGDEWQLRGLPDEPEMRDVFLEIYRNSKARIARETAPNIRTGPPGLFWQRADGGRGVWIAGCGEKYHFDRNCSRLRGGQAAAIARSQSLSWVRQITEHEALELQRDSCSQCGAGTGTRGRR